MKATRRLLFFFHWWTDFCKEWAHVSSRLLCTLSAQTSILIIKKLWSDILKQLLELDSFLDHFWAHCFTILGDTNLYFLVLDLYLSLWASLLNASLDPTSTLFKIIQKRITILMMRKIYFRCKNIVANKIILFKKFNRLITNKKLKITIFKKMIAFFMYNKVQLSCKKQERNLKVRAQIILTIKNQIFRLHKNL